VGSVESSGLWVVGGGARSGGTSSSTTRSPNVPADLASPPLHIVPAISGAAAAPVRVSGGCPFLCGGPVVRAHAGLPWLSQGAKQDERGGLPTLTRSFPRLTHDHGRRARQAAADIVTSYAIFTRGAREPVLDRRHARLRRPSTGDPRGSRDPSHPAQLQDLSTGNPQGAGDLSRRRPALGSACGKGEAGRPTGRGTRLLIRPTVSWAGSDERVPNPSASPRPFT
jgi:hypothetical protein